MVKRFFIFMAVCFLPIPTPAAHADVINDPHEVVMVTGLFMNSPLLIAVLVAVLVVGTAVLIRVFWKLSKNKSS